MTTTAQHTARFRLLAVLLATYFVGLIAVTSLVFATSPSDENLFAAPPGDLMFTEALPPPLPAAEGSAGGAQPGDLLIAVAGKRIASVEGLPGALAAFRDDARVPIAIARHSRDPRESEVSAVALRTTHFKDLSRAAFVIEVTPGGASERAGMQVGDVIVRINGQTFGSVFEADAIMRAGQIGRVTAYEVLRAGRPLTLNVVLARFGVPVAFIAALLTGLVWMAFGLFLALVRPGIKAARYLGLAFLCVGFVVASAFVGRVNADSWFVPVRGSSLVLALLFGMAFWFHAAHYFPRERPALVARRWVRRLLYGLAALGVLAVMVIRADGTILFSSVALLLVVGAALTWRRRAETSAEDRHALRILRVAGGVAGVCAIVVVASLNGKYRDGAALWSIGFILVPAAYAWVIGEYRLLDLDLRPPRSVQVSLLSLAWAAASLVALLAILAQLPYSRMPLPNVRLSGSAVEVLDAPLSAEDRAPLEKGALMVTAIALAFLFRGIGRRGQAFIASKFHREAYDYRRAARELSEVISTRLDLDGLAEGVLATLVRLMAVKRAGVLFVHGTRTHCGQRAHGFTVDAWPAFCRATAADALQGVARAESEVDAEYVFPRLRRALAAAKILYLYPIRAHERVVGVLFVGEKWSESAFRSEDFEFLGAIARQVAPAVENSFLYEELAQQERMKHELALARRIQMESLPQFTPRIQGLDVAGISIPAHEVGGDYFDYLDGSPGRLTVMVGDVSGKGTSAALYMSKLQGILRSLHGFDLSPHELFVRTNQLLCNDLERRSFVTALGGFFDTASRTLVLARAGHLPLYRFLRDSGDVERLLPPGLGFGLSNRQIFEIELREQPIRYEPGDVFLFITDGITECLGPSGDEFGEDRVIELFRDVAARGEAATQIRDRLTTAVQAFSGGVEQYDDQTVVVVRALA